jgi:beta-lactamase class A
LGSNVNDVGVISLPDGERLVLAVFVSKSTAHLEARERVIAEISRAVYDFYLFAGKSANGSREISHGQ